MKHVIGDPDRLSGDTGVFDGFITPKITRASKDLIASSGPGHIQLRDYSNLTLYQLHNIILDVFPNENWDASRFIFLSDLGKPYSEGYIKFDSDLFEDCNFGELRGSSATQNSGDTYLVWRISSYMLSSMRYSINAMLCFEDIWTTARMDFSQDGRWKIPSASRNFERLQHKLEHDGHMLALGSGRVFARTGTQSIGQGFYIDIHYEPSSP